MLWISITYTFLLLRHFLDTGRNVPLFKYFDHFNNQQKKPAEQKQNNICCHFHFPIFWHFLLCFHFIEKICCCYLFYHSYVRISSPLSRIKVSFPDTHIHRHMHTNRMDFLFQVKQFFCFILPVFFWTVVETSTLGDSIHLSNICNNNTYTNMNMRERPGQSICQILSQMKFILLAKTRKNEERKKKQTKFGRGGRRQSVENQNNKRRTNQVLYYNTVRR